MARETGHGYYGPFEEQHVSNRYMKSSAFPKIITMDNFQEMFLTGNGDDFMKVADACVKSCVKEHASIRSGI